MQSRSCLYQAQPTTQAGVCRKEGSHAKRTPSDLPIALALSFFWNVIRDLHAMVERKVEGWESPTQEDSVYLCSSLRPGSQERVVGSGLHHACSQALFGGLEPHVLSVLKVAGGRHE